MNLILQTATTGRQATTWATFRAELASRMQPDEVSYVYTMLTMDGEAELGAFAAFEIGDCVRVAS